MIPEDIKDYLSQIEPRDSQLKRANKYILFEGRHSHPDIENAKPLYKSAIPNPAGDFTFDTYEDNVFEAKEQLKLGREIDLYITGFTPALTHFLEDISDYRGRPNIWVYHYNRDTDSYYRHFI